MLEVLLLSILVVLVSSQLGNRDVPEMTKRFGVGYEKKTLLPNSRNHTDKVHALRTGASVVAPTQQGSRTRHRCVPPPGVRHAQGKGNKLCAG